MELEDARSHFFRAQSNLTQAKDTIEELSAENKFLSKKLLAFLIAKGWNKKRKEAYDKQIAENKEQIKNQMKFVNQKKNELEKIK